MDEQLYWAEFRRSLIERYCYIKDIEIDFKNIGGLASCDDYLQWEQSVLRNLSTDIRSCTERGLPWWKRNAIYMEAA